MATDISKASATKLREHVQRLRSTLARTRERTEEGVQTIVQTVEIGGTAFTLGAINGRYGGLEWAGVPLELWLGGGAHALAFFGGPMPSDLHNLGDGAIACFATTLGAGFGADMRERAGDQTGEALDAAAANGNGGAASGYRRTIAGNRAHDLARLAALAR